MKKTALLFALLCVLSPALFAQQQLPNISYNGLLTSACTNANSSCSGAVFVTGSFGVNVNGSLGSGSALDIPVNNYSSATITVSGTYSGLTLNFDFSDPTAGTNYFQEVCARTDINLLEASEVVPTNQVRAWQCPVWATTRFRVRASAIGSGSANIWITLTYAAIDPSLVIAASITNVAGASDPCSDVSAIKNSTFQTITTATTTALVPPSGSTLVYTCGFQIISSSTTTANTALLEYGTGASCATGPTALTPTYSALAAAATPFVLTYQAAASVLKAAPAGNGVCVVSTVGATPSIQVLYTYVQQ